MRSGTFRSITPEQLDDYMRTHNVKDYLLIDVRQPGEYEQGHIPGAQLIPMMEFVASLTDLPRDRHLIFYCRNDGRSMAAATLAIEEQITHKQIYHLSGGIMAYNGKIQADKPRLKIFRDSTGISDQLKIAMEMEKGTFELYRHLASQLSHQPCGQTFAKLCLAEQHHTRSIFDVWRTYAETNLTFDICFEQLHGEILEGGYERLQLEKKYAATAPDICITAIELALEIEYSAFDLYRTVAETLNKPPAQRLFWDLAESEKAHIYQLSQASG